MLSTPVLFLIFNRLDTVKRVFREIRAQQPSALYIAADGPRPQKGEAERAACSEVRAWVVSQIDWDCGVHTLFREENLGCGVAVSGAITWFFENVEEGIILEDDCLADPSFFSFCEEMLTRYRDCPQVMHISGNNNQDDMGDYPYSYYFSVYSHIWGWAAWRRSWQGFDLKMEEWDAIRQDPDRVKELMFGVYTEGSRRYRRMQFDLIRRGEINSWAYPYLFSLWRQKGLTIIPAVNLVENIGVGGDATHTTALQPFRIRKKRSLDFPLQHPPEVVLNKALDLKVEKRDYTYLSPKRVWDKLKKEFSGRGITGILSAIGKGAGRLFGTFKR
jgi:hypothetical protein